MLPALGQKLISYLAPQNLQSIQMLIKQLCAAAHAGLRNLVQPLLPIARGIHLGTPTRNAPASIQRLEPIHLTGDINPHLTFSVSFLSSPQKHPLYANPWKQWRLARGEEEGKDVKK